VAVKQLVHWGSINLFPMLAHIEQAEQGVWGCVGNLGPGKKGPGKKGPGKNGPVKTVQVKTVLGKNGSGKKGPS